MWLFKLAGLIMIFSAASLTGFLKSAQLRKRHKKLCEIYRSMSDLRERIRIGSGEIARLINVSFESGTVLYTENSVKINPLFLDKEDLPILEEFFADIGMADSKTEYERVGLYMTLIDKRCAQAEQKCSELCRLYNTLGIMCGIFICIFFL